MLSRRTAWDVRANAFAAALDCARAAGRPRLDIAESNPTSSASGRALPAAYIVAAGPAALVHPGARAPRGGAGRLPVDFARQEHLVVSLLLPPEVFLAGFEHVRACVGA